MNCLEFRRRLDTDPAARDPAFDSHRNECAECRAAAERVARFDGLLRRAVAVDLPENLVPRILLRQSFEASRSVWTRRRVLAAAASLLLAVGLAGGIYGSGRGPTLGEAVLTHVNDEAFALSVTGPVDADALDSALTQVGLSLTRSLANVRVATVCMVRSAAAHLVLEGKTGPITVLLMPDEPLDRRVTIANSHMRGVLLPAPRGSIAIVGASGETLSQVEDQILRALDWKA